MRKTKITVFTPTYNRKSTLPVLYRSLLRQKTGNFEWLIVDDGSTDGTEELVRSWMKEIEAEAPARSRIDESEAKDPDRSRIGKIEAEERNEIRFPIRYVRTENGGKPRAMNLGASMSESPFFLPVDSDDYLTDDALEKFTSWAAEIGDDRSFAGVGGARVYPDGTYIKKVLPKAGTDGYVDATNLERAAYDLDADMTEMYRTEIFRKFPMAVFPGEKFAPEQIALNEIALAGYKVRWHVDPVTVCEYREDGLTKGSRHLEKENPVGYAEMYNQMLRYGYSWTRNLYAASQMTALALYGKKPGYLRKTNKPLCTIVTLPFGLLLAVRRWAQFRKI